MSRNHAELLHEAFLIAQTSTDLSTQNGAIVVNPGGEVIGSGANVFPNNVETTIERLQRPQKYLFVVHAESNAILNAAKKGLTTEGATLYSPWAACASCAHAIIQSGIVSVVAHKESMDRNHSKWNESIEAALQMFKEAGVEYLLVSAHFPDILVRFNGESWKP